jgi:hypothetical protein
MRGLIHTDSPKQQSHRKGGFVVLWWWNTELNPKLLLGTEQTVATVYSPTAGHAQMLIDQRLERN